MVDWFLETGLYLLGVAVVPLVGLLLVCWGLWGDRSKGRPRCPKCWYDMRGTVPRLECPECGHDAREERRLYRPHRGWRRMVIGVVLVLLFSYPVTIVGGWYREQASVRRLTKRGYSADVSIRTGPDWLVDRLPQHLARLFDRVTRVSLFGQPATDADLAACARLSYLQELFTGWSSDMTDAGLAHLKGLTRLRTLQLTGREVTDASLVHLNGLTGLDTLSLSGTQVTNAGLVHLKALTGLRELHLPLRPVTDVGLDHLKGMPQLALLVAGSPDLTDADIAQLNQALPGLVVELLPGLEVQIDPLP